MPKKRKIVLPPTHPGEMLREEYLIPHGMTSEELSMHSGIPIEMIKDLVCERIPISPYLAGRLSVSFGTTREFWINLQICYEEQRRELLRQEPSNA